MPDNKGDAMKAGRSLLIFVSFVLAAGFPAFAQDKIGETVYLDGGVSVVRDGHRLDQSEVQTGLEIQNFDMMRTGSDGTAQVSVENPAVPAMTINVSPNTRFSFELSRLESGSHASVGLVGGTLSLKVQKLSGAQSLNVVVDNAVMGVRGTEFTVTSTPSGDVLVVCRSGDVVLTDENGREVHAVPGTAFERLAGRGLSPLDVGAGDPDDFRKAWEEKRRAFLKENALAEIQTEAQTYDRLADEFTETYASLQEKKDLLAKWEAEEKNGTVAAGADVEKEKAEIADLLTDLRETQFLLERVRFRLILLRELHEQGFGRGEIRSGLTTAAFFDRFDRDRGDLGRQLAMVRFAVKLYTHRNDGRDPTIVRDLHRFYERRQAHLKRLQHRRIVKKEM